MYHLNVLPDAKVMVICPHTAISFVKTDLQTPADILFENFWQVDYASFQSCNVNTSNPRNKRFFKCEDPQKLQYEQFIFQSFGIGNRPTFEKGKTHYFICKCNQKWSIVCYCLCSVITCILRTYHRWHILGYCYQLLKETGKHFLLILSCIFFASI